MFFDISAKSQVNTFFINENYAGLVLASDINKLSCSIDTNSMNDNIFSNNSVIFPTLAVSGIMLTASKLLLVILIFQKLFFKRCHCMLHFHSMHSGRTEKFFFYL